MKNYRELQRLKGVGRVSAEALAAAGFTSLAEVAGAAPGELADSLSTVNSPVSPRATDLIKQAKALVKGKAYRAPAERTKRQKSTNGETTTLHSSAKAGHPAPTHARPDHQTSGRESWLINPSFARRSAVG